MIKKALIIIIFVLLSSAMFSQKLETFGSSGYGVSYIQYNSVTDFTQVYNNIDLIYNNIDVTFTLAPRINLALQKELSVSLDLQPTLFLSPYEWFGGALSEGHIKFNVPANININLGYASTKDSQKNFGFFAGVGISRIFAYHFKDEIGYQNDYKGYVIRFGIRYQGRKDANKEVSFYYSGKFTLKHISNYSPSVDVPMFGIRVLKIMDFFHGN